MAYKSNLSLATLLSIIIIFKLIKIQFWFSEILSFSCFPLNFFHLLVLDLGANPFNVLRVLPMKSQWMGVKIRERFKGPTAMPPEMMRCTLVVIWCFKLMLDIYHWGLYYCTKGRWYSLTHFIASCGGNPLVAWIVLYLGPINVKVFMCLLLTLIGLIKHPCT